jgi:hypothetical protein
MAALVMKQIQSCRAPTSGDCLRAKFQKNVVKISRECRDFIRPALTLKTGKPTRTGRELEAISSYAQFVIDHPDMPSYHRERILSEILKCSESARRATASDREAD